MSRAASLLRRVLAVLAHDTRPRARAEVTPAHITYLTPGRSRSARERRRRTTTKKAPTQLTTARGLTGGDSSDVGHHA